MPLSPVKVFVSYAHANDVVHKAFADSLAAAARQGAFEYWDDTKIQSGADWDDVIREELGKADVALLLVSNAFLSSEYCSHVELRSLLLRTRKLFWVIVDDCPWQLSPLSDLQACATLAGMNQAQLSAAATRVVVQIAQYGRELERQRSPAQKFLFDYAPGAAREFANFEPLPGGRHCWVQRATTRVEGGGGDEPVVIKVLLKNPSEDLAGPFANAAARAATLRDPSFIRLRKHFLNERLPVLVMESAGQTLLEDELRQAPFPADRVRDLLITLARAFTELHERGGMYGLLNSHNVFLDPETRGVRCAAISITGLLSQVHDWKAFIGDDPDSASYLIPEQYANQPWSPYSDQYVLGQLGVEMLTGRPPVPRVDNPGDLARKEAFFAAPLAQLEPRILFHEELSAALSRLLQRDPLKRFPTMKHACDELRAVDDEMVGFARYAYNRASDLPGFFDEFYAAFFAACPGARDEFVKAHGGHDTARMTTQSVALRVALGAALAPPDRVKDALGPYGKKHRAVPPAFFQAFAETFVSTLAGRVDLPPFVLDAVRTMLNLAAAHLTTVAV
jgi:serine/threonine protein kinase